MSRAYDIVKATQDLTYLQWDECAQPSGLGGQRIKAREGTGANAVYYKLCRPNPIRGINGVECFGELISSRLMALLGISAAPCQLVHATVCLGGMRMQGWVTRSKSYRKPGEQAMPLDLFWELTAQPGETPLDLCLRMGWEREVGQLALVDYLTATRGRNGSNLEVIRDATGAFRLAPFWGLGFSLAAAFPSETWRVNATADIDTENFLGSRSLEENLSLVPAGLTLPEPTGATRRVLMQGLKGLPPGAYLEGSWQIIKRRLEHYARLRHL